MKQTKLCVSSASLDDVWEGSTEKGEVRAAHGLICFWYRFFTNNISGLHPPELFSHWIQIM